MRLNCPNCGAQYEIESALIPPEGRDVECSACAQVWFQPSPTAGGTAGKAAASDGFDSGARPELSRELNESVLAVLREEAARELRARAMERRNRQTRRDPASADESPSRPPEKAAGTAQTKTPAAPQPQAAQAADPALPEAAHRIDAATPEPAPQPLAPAGEPAAEGPRPLPLAAPPHERADIPPPVMKPAGGTGNAEERPRPAGSSEPSPAEMGEAPDAPVHSGPAGHAGKDPARAALPLAPAQTETEAGAEAGAPSDSAPRQYLPPAIPARPRSRYWLGFALSATAATALLAIYLLAPQIEDRGRIGDFAAGLRAEADQGRLWLDRQLQAVRPD